MNVTGKLKTRLAAVLLLVLLVAGIKYLVSGNLDSGLPTERIYAFDSFVMGTLLTVKVRAPVKDEARHAADAARAEVTRLHRIFDPGDPRSEVSLLNDSRGGGRAVALSPEMSHVLGAALRLRDLSGGAFDPSMGELCDLWGFSSDRRRSHPPKPEQIRAILDSTTLSRDIVLTGDGGSALIGGRAGALDLGGIAKGYAVDRAVQVLREAGVRDALVNLGGEIGVLGVGSNRTCWSVGVQHPRNSDSHLGAISLNEGKSVATSGDYERFFVDGGRRYHHILNPFNGYPADSGVVGITVVASSCMEADGMGTAALILGPVEGIELLENAGCEGLIIYVEDGRTEDGKLRMVATSGFSRYLPNPDLDGLPLP